MKAGTMKRRPTELLGILTLSIGMILLCLLLALSGAGAERSLGEDTDSLSQHWKALSYIQERSREHNRTGATAVVELSGTNALQFKTDEGAHYLYYREGALWTLFTTEESPLLESGQAVALCPELEFRQEREGLIWVSVGSESHGIWLGHL